MVSVVPYATAYVAPRQILPGLTYLPNTHTVLRKNDRKVNIGNVIHFDAIHGSIENHIKSMLP